MTIIEDLAARVAQAWGRHRYQTLALSDVAATELDRRPLHKEIDYNDLLTGMVDTGSLPFQHNLNSDFGEPPLTLYWHPRFYVEALFWCTSTTAIHGHGFTGAFQVLNGTSLQSLFLFDSDSPAVSRCRLGNLRQTDARVLHPGSTQQIQHGERFVHSVFHLGYPSVTIIVRTFGGNPSEPQYTYYRPGVAVPHGLEFDQWTRRLLQIVTLQARLRSKHLMRTVAAIAEKCDLAAAFTLLQAVQPILYRQGQLLEAGQLLTTLAEAHGLATATKLTEAVSRERGLDRLRAARSTVIDEELRLFLALLLTQQRRRFVLSEVQSFTGSPSPDATLASWIRKLADRGVLHVPADDKTERLLSRWLGNGRGPEAGDGLSETDVAQGVAALKREPLLEALLFEAPA